MTPGVSTFDCFTFFNEFDALELRMTELWDVVDRFVAVEASVTFSGDAKPYHLTERVDELGPLREKLTIFRVNDLPVVEGNRWPTEIAQRNAIAKALSDLDASPCDLILVSDVDEIPRAPAVDVARQRLTANEVLAFGMSMFYYRLDLYLRGSLWIQSKLCRASLLDLATPHEIRTMYAPPAWLLKDSGWHFSYLSPRGRSADWIQSKLAAFSHSEVQAPNVEWPSGQRVYRSHLGDLLEPVGDDRFPSCVTSDAARWAAFRQFPDGPAKRDLLAYEASRIAERLHNKGRQLLRSRT